VWTAALGLVLAAAANGAEEEPWQRLLKGDDAKKATELQQQIDKLTESGKFAEAVKPAEEVLALRQRVQGDKHWETVTARVVRDTLKHVAAQPAASQQDIVTANKQMAEADRLDQRARYAEAEPLLRQALAIRRKVLGEQHPDTATSLDNLAGNLYYQGKYPEAETLYRQALAINRKALGEQHLDTAQSLNNLAGNLRDQGKYAEAEPLLRQALASFRKVLGQQHPLTATSLNNLANNLDYQGKYAEAEPLHRQALAINRKALGEQHPGTATSLNYLAFNLDHQGKHAEAEPLHRQALAILRKVLGEQHPHTASSLNNLAANLDDQGKYAEAEPLYRQALAIRRKVLGEQHPDTAQSLNNLANNLDYQGKYAEAEPLHRQALAIRRKALGEHHPDTALSLHNLALNLDYQGKHAEAEPLHRQALAIRRKVLGEQHPDTARGLNWLAYNLHAQGKYAEAEPLYRAGAASFEMARLRVTTTGFERAPFGARFSPLAVFAACLAWLDKPSDAWRAAESGLARGLLDDLSARLPSPLDPEQRQRQQARAARLDQLDRLLLPLLTAQQLSKAEQTQQDTLSRERDILQTEQARDAADLARREVWSLDRIQKQIPADAALVFWIDWRALPKAADPNGEHWACVVRQRGTPAWVRLPGSGDKDAWTPADDQLPRRLHGDLATGEPGWRGRARQLARQRLTPLEPHLKARHDLPAVRRLIAVPAGAMAGIPLEVLTNEYILSYTPSGTLFARLREQRRPLHKPPLLALGDPNFSLPADKPAPLPEHGLLLTLVLPGDNASKAGLRGGDVLLAYNGQKLTTLADLKPAASGDPVPVQVWRDGKTFEARLSAGKLGVTIDRDPAPAALRRQRDFDALLASRTRDNDKIDALPASRYEVQALETLFAKPTVLLGSEASEQKLDELAAADQLKDYRVLHFATHGTIDLASPLRSSLLLARDRLPDVKEQARLGRKIYDGRLRAAIIAEPWRPNTATWRLDADLVTLSACQTALGPQGGGDGLLGFSQVLFQKGAHSLLLSLWKVDDTATALLMTRFYENWLGKRKDLKGKLPKAEALREAKQWLRTLPRGERDQLAANLVDGRLRGTEVAAQPVVPPSKEAADQPYAHPRYWAAFILIGDPE
jgi:tetratricopeptide (TPR) repeat protein